LKYMNVILDMQTAIPNRRFHMILDGQRLCLRQDPLPTEFVHYPSVPKGGSPMCSECQTRLDTIITNNPKYKN